MRSARSVPVAATKSTRSASSTSTCFRCRLEHRCSSDNYIGARADSQFSKDGDGRVDHHFYNGDLVYLRYTYNRVDTTIGSLFPAVNSGRRQSFSRAATWPTIRVRR